MKTLTKHTNMEYNKWYEYTLKIGNSNINLKLLEIAIKELLDILNLSNITEDKNVLIQFKVKNTSGIFRSISYMQDIKFKDINQLIDIFYEFWSIKSEEYYQDTYTELIFIINIPNQNNKSKIIKVSNIIKNSYQIKFGGFNLPKTMDFTLWGNVRITNNYTNAIVYKTKSLAEYHIQLFDSYTLVEYKIGEKTLLTFKDIMTDKEDLSTFTRIINKQTYYFNNGLLIVKTIKKSPQFLTNIKKTISLTDKFITMDLETRNIDGKMTPYCISIYDGYNLQSFYLTNYYDEKFMLRASVDYLLKRKYHNQRVYLHNFSKFDVIFLLSTLSNENTKLKPIIRDGKFITLKLIFANKYTLYFRDSLLLLPSSLDNLSETFNVSKKGKFPFDFVNKKGIALDYVGEVPSYKYYNSKNLTFNEYIEYIKNYNNDWDLKKETIKYCEQDCISLHQVIKNFSREIWKRERIDIFKYPTLSSLAFAIFRTNYLKNSKIPLINGETYNFIKEAYTGGSVDVYKPKAAENQKVYRYDVNSLYPYAMIAYPMPVGNYTYFEGDYSLIKDKPFGFFEVEIRTPNYLKVPILQVKVKTKSGFRTIAPIGTWTGIYFSEELYNAEKLGYSFKIKRGYLFEKGNIFKEYVNKLYQWKLECKNDNDKIGYLISKLLLNNLYGRLGMNPQKQEHLIVSEKESLNIIKKHNVREFLDLKNGKFFISYDVLKQDRDIEIINNISVSISAAVTANARVFMSKFKNDFSLYSDTDSLDTTIQLPSGLIGDNIGQFKLEHIFNEVVFLAPKVYGGKTETYEYVRIKGLKNVIPFNELSLLLKKGESLEIKQEKWYRDIPNNQIIVKDEIHTLMATDNKRMLIYNKEGVFIDTEPLKLIDGKLI